MLTRPPCRSSQGMHRRAIHIQRQRAAAFGVRLSVASGGAQRQCVNGAAVSKPRRESQRLRGCLNRLVVPLPLRKFQCQFAPGPVIGGIMGENPAQFQLRLRAACAPQPVHMEPRQPQVPRPLHASASEQHERLIHTVAFRDEPCEFSRRIHRHRLCFQNRLPVCDAGRITSA